MNLDMAPTQCPIIILDGGMGTTLSDSQLGFQFDQSTPLWSSHLLINQPSALQAVHTAFGHAGAEILLTASYQASFEGFEKTLGPRYQKQLAIDYMNSSIALAVASGKEMHEQSKHRQRGHGFTSPCVALSLGPLGATLVPSQEYSGAYPPEMASQTWLETWHRRRLAAFIQEGGYWEDIEFIAFETFKRTDEIHAVRNLMSNYHSYHPDRCGKPRTRWWISTVWPDDDIDDSNIEDTVKALLENTRRRAPLDNIHDTEPTPHVGATPWAIGVNCTALSKAAKVVEKMEQVVTALASSGKWRNEWSSSLPDAVDRPWLVLYPDGAQGLRYDTTLQQWIADSSRDANVNDSWASAIWKIASQIRARGHWAGIVLGGCCKTGPHDISELRGLLDKEEGGG